MGRRRVTTSPARICQTCSSAARSSPTRSSPVRRHSPRDLRPRNVAMIPDYRLTQLDVLEAEAIHVLREVAAEFERPALLFSGGKDSIVRLLLAYKSFLPTRIAFPVMHIDTGHNFSEVLEFCDRRVG